MSTSTVIILAVIVILVIWAIGVYNSLISMRQRVNQAYADIDVQLRQRHDLVPNLVETVKGYAAHERGTLDEVVKARNAAMTAQNPAQQAAAENMLTGALRQLFAVAEDRGDATFLQQCCAGIQYRDPAFSRRFVRFHLRFRAENLFRSRRRACDRWRSAAGQVLTSSRRSNLRWRPMVSTAISNRTGAVR